MSAFLVAFVLAATSLTAAQENTTGTLAGRAVDRQGLPVPGVTVTATGPQGMKTSVTDAEGRFSIPFLTPGQYSLRAELQGFKPVEQQDIVVSLGQRVELALTLEVGAFTETVKVTAASPVINVGSTTVGGTLDSESLKRLPVGRSLAETLYVVPGVSESAGINTVGSRANPSIGGASGLENNYVVDGVNITDVGFGGFGAYNSNHGSLGTGVTFDFIKETQVKTGGFEAEYGEATGGVVNVVTKSGSNTFSGSVFGYARPSSLEAQYKVLTTPNGSVNTTGRDDYDSGISLGGRIIPNKLFFFGTYNPQWQNRSFAAPAGFPYASLGDVERKRTIQAYAGKITGQAGSAHRFDFSVFGDPSKGDPGLQRFSTLRRIAYPGVPGTTDIRGGFSELDYGGHSQTARYDGILGSRWLLEGSFSNSANKFDETPTVDEWLFTDFRSVPNGTSGGLGYIERNKGSNKQLSAKSTNILRGAGQHEIRYGIGYDDIDFIRDSDYSGPGVTLANGRQTVTGVNAQIRTGGGVTYYRATRGKLLPSADTTQKYTSFFLQDRWQAGRLTVQPGVRWEKQYLEGGDPATGPDLCFEGDSRPGAGDGTGPAIACNFTWKQWAPRIGATYDLTGTGKTKVFGSWGRFYAKIPNDLAARAMSADSGITRQNFRDPGLTQPVANGESFAGQTVHLQLTSDAAAIIDPNAGSTYRDEVLAGIEFEVIRNTSLGFRYVHRKMPQMLEDIGQLSILGYFEAPDTPVDYFITNVNASTPVVQCCGYIVAFENPENIYNSFEVTLNRRFSNNWGAIASYRYSQLKGNFEGFFRSDNGQSDPSISSLFDFPTNDPSYSATRDVHGGSGDIRYQGTTLGAGVLPNDRPHQVKLYGNYMWSNLNVGLGLNAGTGRSLTGLASNPVYNNAGEIPLTIRGDGLQTLSGFRERAPMDFQVDMHADYGLRFGGRRVTLLADVFNLFNRHAATDFDNWYELSIGALNPNFGLDTNGGGSSTNSYQAPISLRLGARFDW
ncbi:MAG TPA: carboxypeptidase regulatory-like domain-containing protein [Vicinamibacterales bacterium]|nr:carboxypeptidase regulatory-like domain-containing protein [Vicinamibacterales bacterium]